ncbi:MAG: MBL fold metallo-hydrolase [Candidatus Diapherotrites archaeon]|nr:MBL fold metallo-hydrolase [Candidatus Diapherotrites archaeon]
MKITKLGHCCLLVKEKELNILTDPGAYSTEQNSLKGIDVVLITHEHQDHCHIESVKKILTNNPNAKIITNKGVAKILENEGIEYELLEHGQNKKFKNVLIEGFGEKHAEMYHGIPLANNTGYFIAGRLFYPGDSFFNLGKQVEILALPVAGPWMKLSEAINYTKELKPKICFPVHDGMLQTDKLGPAHSLPKKILSEFEIEFLSIENGKEIEL